MVAKAIQASTVNRQRRPNHRREVRKANPQRLCHEFGLEAGSTLNGKENTISGGFNVRTERQMKRGIYVTEGLMPFLGPLRCILAGIPGIPC